LNKSTVWRSYWFMQKSFI